MAPKKIKLRQEERSAAIDFLKKADDNYLQMISALQAKNYNAVGTLAVQCAISSADAISVYEKGIRSISDDHFDVCGLVGSVSMPDAKEKANLLKRIIGKKNVIQYERRNIHQSEAEDLLKSASRFYQWVSLHINF